MFRTMLLASSALTVIGTARADYIPSFAYTDRGVMTGTFTRYATSADAAARTNPTSSGAVAPIDASIFFVRDITSIGPAYNPYYTAPNTAQFFNQWFYQVPGGATNPNNNGNNFVQVDDFDGSAVTSHRGFWTDSTYQTFQLQVHGQNATALPGDPIGDPDGSRFAQTGNIPDTNPAGYGTWIEYDLDLTATGFSTYVSTPGMGPDFVQAVGDPAGLSGTFTGVFRMNDQADNPFYRVDLTITLGDTYGFINRRDLAHDGVPFPYTESAFGGSAQAVNAVPAPPAAVLAGVAGGILLVRRVRRRPA